jgi:hypothetical protein
MSQATAAPSTDNPLFYSNPVPLDRNVHRALKTGVLNTDYSFARSAHFVPALIDEFSPASREMPIVFLPTNKTYSPVFMLGLRAGENRLIKDDGAFTTTYVPAYLRRYPFILGEEQGRDPVVCIDAGNLVLSETDGETLFDDDGQPTQSLQNMVDLATNYFEAGKRTQAFVSILDDLGLFRQITIESRTSSDGQTIHGLAAIDENKLYELSDADFLTLRTQRLLGPIFAHFFSLSQIDRLR